MLTGRRGVVRALAKGARRMKGQNAAAFDLFSLLSVNLRLRKDDGLGNLGAVDLLRTWDYLRTDVRRLAFASLGVEVLGTVASISQHEPYFLAEATDFLTLLEEDHAPGSLATALLLRLLHHAGHPPRMIATLVGDSPPTPLAYDFREGAVVARDPSDSSSWPLDRELVGVLLPALTAPPPLGKSFVVPARLGPPALRWLIKIWEDHLGQRLAAGEFLEKTVFMGAPC
jgi:recombinational DNA repair protein (RecF pathway)